MNIKQIDKEIIKHKEQLKRLGGKREEVLKRKFILCMNCRKATKLSSLIFIQNHWYEEPYSCSGGAQWHEDDDQSYFECPKCGEEFKNRMCVRKDGKFLADNKHLFKEIWKRHDYKGLGTVIKKPGDEDY